MTDSVAATVPPDLSPDLLTHEDQARARKVHVQLVRAQTTAARMGLPLGSAYFPRGLTLAQVVEQYVQAALAALDGNKTAAAKALYNHLRRGRRVRAFVPVSLCTEQIAVEEAVIADLVGHV